ncbi:MAG TPA: PqqD family protein [Thermoanaerobaculia bacterium]|nr:PqqD family protein [Thermoanaerobaculia bacterium]
MKPAAGVVFKSVGDELVLLDYDRGIYYGLDAVGARLWELIAAGEPLPSVIETLLGEYDVSREEVTNDAQRLVGELRERGLLVD